jgi:hypothetical protein
MEPKERIGPRLCSTLFKPGILKEFRAPGQRCHPLAPVELEEKASGTASTEESTKRQEARRSQRVRVRGRRMEWDGVRDCITPGKRRCRSLSIIGIASAVILPDTRSSHKTRCAGERNGPSDVRELCIRCRSEGSTICFGDSESTARQRLLMGNSWSQ